VIRPAPGGVVQHTTAGSCCAALPDMPFHLGPGPRRRTWAGWSDLKTCQSVREGSRDNLVRSI